jgi:hypothetical protein
MKHEFCYKQRKQTPEWRQNFDAVFRTKGVDKTSISFPMVDSQFEKNHRKRFDDAMIELVKHPEFDEVRKDFPIGTLVIEKIKIPHFKKGKP